MHDSASERKLVSVVLNWRKPEMTAACVRSLLAEQVENHEIVIVDNGSDDGSYEFLSHEFAGLAVLDAHENLGFSRGCNVGIAHAVKSGATFIGLVNNDLTMSPGSLAAAVSALLRDPGLGAVTGKVYVGDGPTIWQAGGYISHTRIMGIPRGLGELDRGQYGVQEETRWASGAMSVFRTEALTDIGLLPSEYFFGQEEWDMSTNLLRRGWRIAYVPEFVGYHEAGSSHTSHPALHSYGLTRNRHLYAEKYLSPWGYRAWRVAFWLHLRLIIWPKMIMNESHPEPRAHARAMRLAWKRHQRGKPVTLDELSGISREMNLRDGWD